MSISPILASTVALVKTLGGQTLGGQIRFRVFSPAWAMEHFSTRLPVIVRHGR
jgi:hypothetical protein